MYSWIHKLIELWKMDAIMKVKPSLCFQDDINISALLYALFCGVLFCLQQWSGTGPSDNILKVLKPETR